MCVSVGVVGGSWEVRQKTCFYFFFFFPSTNSLFCCECPIKLPSHLLAAYPRSVGGFRGLLRLGVWGFQPCNSENRPTVGTGSTQIFFSCVPSLHIFHTLPEKVATATSAVFCHDCPFFGPCTRPSSSPWHCHNFSLSHHFFFILHRGTHSYNLTEEKEPASFKLSTKSKLYVHDMSEAVLYCSVCLLSLSKAHCSFCIFLHFFPLIPLPR